MNFLDHSTGEKNILTVRQLNEAISEAMRLAFPATVWVRGEVQRLPLDAARRTHVYFELHETGQSGAAEYQIPVALMGWDRSRHGLGRYLDGTDPDIQLANKMEVCLECQVDFYAKFGKLSLKVVGVDKSFALGRLEALRRATLKYLEDENLLELNRAIPLSEMPLRVGLITSPGSAAERDFMTGLEGSPFGFQVSLAGAKMQGEQLQAEGIRSLVRLQEKDLDVIVITRGGGSRADLSWFDQKDLAETIARCRLPVITAIGHEIDRSIADLVAHHSCKTPTAAAEFLVERLEAAAERVQLAAATLQDEMERILEQAAQRIDLGPDLIRAARSALLMGETRFQRLAGRFQSVVTAQLKERRRRLNGLETRLAIGVRDRSSGARALLAEHSLRLQSLTVARLKSGQNRLEGASGRLNREARRPLGQAEKKLQTLAMQARLVDPQRLLARGYTLTLDRKGKVITSAADLAAGDRLQTRFVDGQVTSIVQPEDSAGSAPAGKATQRGGKKKQENPGQETLFR